MQVLYLFALLLLSSARRLSADLPHSQSRLEHRADDKGTWDESTDRKEGSVLADKHGRQNGTGVGSNGDADKQDSARDLDGGKVGPRETQDRIPFKPDDGSYTQTLGGFVNTSASNITTSPAHVTVPRSAGQCKFPTNLKESELDCTTYPNKVVCTQTCMFGYTLEGKDGIKRHMECIYEENQWKPVAKFERCKPFVDCGLTIGPGGSYKCRKNYMYKGPDCDIACKAYEGKTAVPLAKYECDIQGKWTPQLPFCAKGGSGLKLVPVPPGPKRILGKKDKIGMQLIVSVPHGHKQTSDL